jgi:hypothetical protein
MLTKINSGRFYLDKDQHRHWCPISEPVTGGDVLESMLNQGWKISGGICYHQWHSLRGRNFHQYQFCLERDFHMINITVIANPFVQRLISRLHLAVIECEAVTAH